MKEIIENYGGAILVFIVIIALIGIMGWLLTSNGVIAQQFQQLLDSFFSQAGGNPGTITPPTTP